MRTAAPASGASTAVLAAAVLVAASTALALASGATVGAIASAVWPLAVSLLIAPIVEETVFRSGLHDGLLHQGIAPWLANLVTAFAFSAAHMLLTGPSLQSVMVFLPALLIGAAFTRWRRLRVCIVMHAAMNALWLALHRVQ